MADIMENVSSSQLITAISMCASLGALILFFAYANKKIELKERNWPKTEAIITNAEITGGAPTPAGSAMRAGGFMWRFSLEYEYIVNDKPFTGTDIKNTISDITSYTRDSNPTEESISKEILNYQQKYPVGKKVEIWHSMSRPKKSFIEVESRTLSTVILTIIGLKFLFIAAIFLKALFVRS